MKPNLADLNRLALLSPEEMSRADRLATIPSITLMENAGRAVARSVIRHYRPCRTLVLCGPGNNGGDGYVAARLLAQRGWPVTVAALAPSRPGALAPSRAGALAPSRPGSDAATARAGWTGPIAAFDPAEAARADLVIDAVFGAGLSRPLDGLACETLAAARRILAIDMPSGIDGATGAVRGSASLAEVTVSFFRRKPGHLLLPGRECAGVLEIADIGIAPEVLETVAPRTWHNRPGLWRLRALTAHDHKYTRGVVSICGGTGMSGAARLSAEGARHGGAGLVRIAAGEGADLYRTGPPGLIVDAEPLATLLGDTRRQVWVCGPGLDVREVEAVLPHLIAAGRAVVADAGALSAAAGDPQRLRGVAVITPHAGEFARLFGDPGEDRLGAARAASASIGAVLVLKGSDTIIAAPDGRAAINDNAPPWLGTAGAGDVLSGIVAAQLAGGMQAFEAACASVWLHGEAASLAGEGLVAEDLAPRLAAAIVAARAALA